MTDFPGYPAVGEPDPGARYVIVTTRSTENGDQHKRSQPLSLGDAEAVLAKISRGEVTKLVLDPIELVAEAGPRHLYVFVTTGFFGMAKVVDVRLLPVLWPT